MIQCSAVRSCFFVLSVVRSRFVVAMVLFGLLLPLQAQAFQGPSSITKSFELSSDDLGISGEGPVSGTYTSRNCPEVTVVLSGNMTVRSGWFALERGGSGSIRYVIESESVASVTSVRAGHGGVITGDGTLDSVTFGPGLGDAIESHSGTLPDNFSSETAGSTGSVTFDNGNGNSGIRFGWKSTLSPDEGTITYDSNDGGISGIFLNIDYCVGLGVQQTISSTLATCDDACSGGDVTSPGADTTGVTIVPLLPQAGGSGCSGCSGGGGSGGSNPIDLNLVCDPSSESQGGSIGDGCFTNYDFTLKFYRCGSEYVAVLFDPCSGSVHEFRNEDGGSRFEPTTGTDYSGFTVTDAGANMEDLTDASAVLYRQSDGSRLDFEIKNTTNDGSGNDLPTSYPARLSTLCSSDGQKVSFSYESNSYSSSDPMEQLKVTSFRDEYNAMGTVTSSNGSGRYLWDKVVFSGLQGGLGGVVTVDFGSGAQATRSVTRRENAGNPVEILSLTQTPVDSRLPQRRREH